MKRISSRREVLFPLKRGLYLSGFLVPCVILLIALFYVAVLPKGPESGIFVRWAPSPQAVRDTFKLRDARYRYADKVVITDIKVVSSRDGRRQIELDERMPRITLVVKGRALSIESAAPYLEEKVCKDYKRSGVEYGGYFNAVAVLAFDRDVLERLPYQDLIEITDMLKNVNFNSVYLTYLD